MRSWVGKTFDSFVTTESIANTLTGSCSSGTACRQDGHEVWEVSHLKMHWLQKRWPQLKDKQPTISPWQMAHVTSSPNDSTMSARSCASLTCCLPAASCICFLLSASPPPPPLEGGALGRARPGRASFHSIGAPCCLSIRALGEHPPPSPLAALTLLVPPTPASPCSAPWVGAEIQRGASGVIARLDCVESAPATWLDAAKDVLREQWRFESASLAISFGITVLKGCTVCTNDCNGNSRFRLCIAATGSEGAWRCWKRNERQGTLLPFHCSPTDNPLPAPKSILSPTDKETCEILILLTTVPFRLDKSKISQTGGEDDVEGLT